MTAETIKKEKTIVNKATVVTFDGSIHPRASCRKIKEMYYLIGDVNIKGSGQCYCVNDVYYIDSGINARIQWDYTNNRYTTQLDGLVRGFVSSKGDIGYFVPSVYDNLLAMKDGGVLYIMNESCIPTNYGYDYSDGYFKQTDKIGAKKPFVSQRNKPYYKTLKTDLYGFGEDLMTGAVEELYKKYVKDNIKSSIFDKYFGKYTYGLEIETDGGWLPECFYYRHGALPLKDGSIYGTEVTTFPYTNEKIFNNLAGLCKALSTYTIATYNTSVHVNIGNVPNNPYFRTAIWILYCRLQSEIEAFIPSYKRDQRFFQEKRGQGKDHCRIQESLNLLRRYLDWKTEIPIADAEIKKFLNEGRVGNRYVRTGQAKWDQRSRYYALNMLPMYFPNNGAVPRLEFRVHSGSVNTIKIICWTLICQAIVKFAEEQQERIFIGKEKITLQDVIEYAFVDGTEEGLWLTNYILSYISSRTKEHINTIQTDNVYGSEFSDDNTYLFQYDKMTLLTYESSKRSQPRKEGSEGVQKFRF